MKKEQKEDKVILWNDVVSLKDLIISISIAVVFTMGLFFFAESGNRSQQLFYGLGGAVLGFVINSIVFKPKRVVKEEETE